MTGAPKPIDRRDKKEDRKANRRGAARLAAVQALYQMDVASTGLNEIFGRLLLVGGFVVAIATLYRSDRRRGRYSRRHVLVGALDYHVRGRELAARLLDPGAPRRV